MNIESIKLLRGTHEDTAQTGSGCVMNLVAYLNGESVITDQSPCVCVTVRPIAIFLNDLANDEQRQRMLPLVMRMMGSRTDDKAEISRRLGLLVEFANWQAGLAAKYAAESAAKYAAEYAAKYAAKYAEYAAESAAEYKTVTFDRGLALLDAMLPPASEPAPEVVQRAKTLVKLNTVAA